MTNTLAGSSSKRLEDRESKVTRPGSKGSQNLVFPELKPAAWLGAARGVFPRGSLSSPQAGEEKAAVSVRNIIQKILDASKPLQRAGERNGGWGGDFCLGRTGA